MKQQTEKQKSYSPSLGLGMYLRSLRDARGLTLRDAEEKSGISNAFLSQVESGKVKHPSPIILYKLANLYEVPYEILMDRAGYPVPQKAKEIENNASAVFHRLGQISVDEEQALLDYLSFLRNRTKRSDRQK